MRFIGEQIRIRENRIYDDIITFVLGYVIASFLLTALFVRLGKQTALARKIREHFYWFPFIPPVLIAWGLLQAVDWTTHRLASLTRRCFEILSGKKTYRRQKIGAYYHD